MAQRGPSYAVIDVETTGLDPARNEVIDLAVVITDPAGVAMWEWTTRVRPHGPMGASHIHGLTDGDVAGAPPFGDVAAYLAWLLAGRILVAHNASFDTRFLHAEYARAGWDLPCLPAICTRDAGRRYLPHVSSWRLPDVAAAVGVPLHNAHSALGDARATAGLLHAYLTRTPDCGQGMAWYQAWQQAAAVTWPTGPTRPPVPLPGGGSIPRRPYGTPQPRRAPGQQSPLRRPTPGS